MTVDEESEFRIKMDRLHRADYIPETTASETDNIEQNGGVEFPGLQLDERMSHKFYDFQKTADSFSAIEKLIVEQGEIISAHQSVNN